MTDQPRHLPRTFLTAAAAGAISLVLFLLWQNGVYLLDAQIRGVEHRFNVWHASCKVIGASPWIWVLALVGSVGLAVAGIAWARKRRDTEPRRAVMLIATSLGLLPMWHGSPVVGACLSELTGVYWRAWLPSIASDLSNLGGLLTGSWLAFLIPGSIALLWLAWFAVGALVPREGREERRVLLQSMLLSAGLIAGVLVWVTFAHIRYFLIFNR